MRSNKAQDYSKGYQYEAAKKRQHKEAKMKRASRGKRTVKSMWGDDAI